MEIVQKIFLRFFFGDCLKKIFESPEKNFEDLFFLENTCACVLGLEHSCPWLREGLSSKGLSLASNFFVSLALVSSLVSSTPPLVLMYGFYKICNQAVHDKITSKKEPFCLPVARKKTAKYGLYMLLPLRFFNKHHTIQ